MKSLLWGIIALLALSAPACSRTEETPEALMKTGLDALYTKKDPDAAAKTFRKVIEKNPQHYGANYQLATALDRAGKQAEATPLWEKVVVMAETYKDDSTLQQARRRLGREAVASAAPAAPATPADAAMKAGLDALYVKRDPGAAIVEFRKVLAINPTHYGATYQLAAALDQTGKAAEARPLWEKVLKMADDYKDAKTASAAKERLARRP